MKKGNFYPTIMAIHYEKSTHPSSLLTYACRVVYMRCMSVCECVYSGGGMSLTDIE